MNPVDPHREAAVRELHHQAGYNRSTPKLSASGETIRQHTVGSVRGVLQKPILAGGHGMLVMLDITDPSQVARHDRDGRYEGIC
jgi:hypothetical protein